MEKESNNNQVSSNVSEAQTKQSEQMNAAVKKPKKRSKILYNFSPFELTMIVLGILLAVLLIVVFYYLYNTAAHTNKAIPQNGLISSDIDKSWETRVVNSTQGLTVEYEVATSAVTGAPGVQVDSRITKETVEMLEDLRKAVPDENVTLLAGYTSVQNYADLYNARVEQLYDEGYSMSEAKELALQTIMLPGTDEHSTGLLVNVGIDGSLDPSVVAASQSYQWLITNSWKYGFILRYPEGKEDVTLHGYDPTAFRYVGLANAKAIHDSGITLEEYNAILAEQAAQQAAEEAAAAEAAAQAEADAQVQAEQDAATQAEASAQAEMPAQ